MLIYCLQTQTVYEIEADDVHEDLYENNDLFDSSNYP